MKRIFILASLLCVFCTIKAQNRFPDQMKHGASFYEMRDAFENHFEKPELESSRLKKKFARWEYFYSRRVDETGHIPHKLIWDEWKKAQRNSGNGFSYANWTEVGPREVPHCQPFDRPGGIGRIDCITFHPTDENIYWIGTPAGGLWKTYDDGAHWINLTDNLPTLGVSDLKVHPNDANTLFMATGTRDTWWETYSVGILKSTDGGYSWEVTGLNFEVLDGNQVSEILINPENPDIMLAATKAGIFRSEDGSESWERVGGYSWVKDLAFKPGDYSVVYATTFNPNGGARFRRSDDGGKTFMSVNDVGFNRYEVNRICIATTPANPELIYLLCSSSTNNDMYGFYKSTDGGESWFEPIADEQLNLIGYNVDGHDNQGFGYYMIGFVASPFDENELYAGGANIWKSTDGGVNWINSADWQGRQQIDYVHADQHMLTYNPHNQAVFSGCDGGIYKKDAGSDDWVDKSGNLGIMQLYKLGLYYADDSRALLGPQDNGIISLSDDYPKEIWLAEAGDHFYDQNNPENIFFSGYGLGLCKSMNGGDEIYQIHPAGETKYVFNPPFIMHPAEDVIFCAFNDIYRSENRGATWTKIMEKPDTDPRILSLEVAASDVGVLYASDASRVWRTLNNGDEWVEVTDGLLPGSSAITDIAISTENPMHVWVTYAGYSAENKVYKSTDGGENWINISLGLPNLPVNCITYEPGSGSSVYIGTDLGVYFYNDALDDWLYFSDGLPNVIVNELEINPLNDKIKAATFGRGLWESPLMTPTITAAREIEMEDLRVYPNPNQGEIFIDLKKDIHAPIELQLIDFKGRNVLRKNLPDGTSPIHLSLPGLPSGSYVLKIGYNNEIQSVIIGIVR